MEKKAKLEAKSGFGDAVIQCEAYSCEDVYDASRTLSKQKSDTLFNICFVASGSGIHRVLDREIPCGQGDICIIPPNTPHAFFLTDADGSLTIRRIRFDLSDWFSGDTVNKDSEDYCYGAFGENETIAYATLNSYLQNRVHALFNYIECEVLEQRSKCHQLIRGYLENLLINVGRYVNSAIKEVSFASPKEWRTVSAAINIIRTEYADSSLTLDSVAERTYTSKSQLSRMFKRVTGIYFSEYLRNARIRRVCKLLEDGDENVEAAARACGFHNMAAFYKTFGESVGMTPKEYRIQKSKSDSASDEYRKLLKGEKIMSILNEISENLQKGRAKNVKALVQQALDEGIKPADILAQGLLAGMAVVGEKFKNNEVYVPEVLVAARAMNMGSEILKPYLAAEGTVAAGKVCLGTVHGDLHDIGKNLVKMMMEGKGLEVVDLGTDVPAEKFIQTAIDENCQVICCSALLTTTMPVMEEVVKAAEAAGIRDKVKIMVGGAPVTQEFCDQIGADCYTVDAASAADAAAAFCKK